MTLQSSGPISISQIAAEFGGTTPHSLNEYYGVHPSVPSSGAISMSDFYGASLSANVQYLVIASGGGSPFGAGGGAGGMLEGTLFMPTGSTGTVTVGDAVTASSISTKVNGQDSVLTVPSLSTTITAIGGGSGGGSTSNNNADGRADGNNGGSGGGSTSYGTFSEGAAGQGTPGQGNDGSQALNSRGGYQGGGGGAGGNASAATGGAGKTSNITGTSTTYAQGGSAGASTPSPLGSGSGLNNTASRKGVIILRVPSGFSISFSGVSVSSFSVGTDECYQVEPGSGTFTLS